MLKAEAHVNIKIYDPEKGGIEFSTTFDNSYGVVFKINDKLFDCRLLFEQPCCIHPGESRNNIPVKFLCYEGVKKELQVNKKFFMWRGGNIGEGTIIDFIE